MGDAVAAAAPLLLDGRLLHGVNTALVLLISVAPILSADAVARPAAILRKLLGGAAAAALTAAANAIDTLRRQREFGFCVVHGALTYACGDVLAQAVAPPADDGSKVAGSKVVGWRPRRTLRTAISGVLSDALPFYYWSSALQTLELPGLLGRLPAGILATKIALHAGLFQPATTAAFLASQPLLRGDGWAAARALLAKRFAQAYAAGASTFVVGGLLVYSLPSVALQSALRNLGVLAFGIYLALVSN